MKFDIAAIDRRWIYLLVFLSLAVPLYRGYRVTPARLESAEKLYAAVESIERRPGKIAVVAMDFGPNLIAENGAQTEVVLEHLFRRRIPVVLFSLYNQAEPFLTSIPEGIAARLAVEYPGERWTYGVDWVNVGFQPGGYLFIQSLPKADKFMEALGKDVRGNSIASLPIAQGVGGFESVALLGEFTGLLGMFDTYVQFFQKKDYRPVFTHGCTSITIPEAFIYLDSGQLTGLLEGIAGAAWYSELLQRAHPARKRDSSGAINTGLGVAHLIIIIFILLGNLGMAARRNREEGR
ncbi:MAG: hypothetical protein RL417_1383 [Pseudomonadota bacterium]|jgi:hypothetical protein